MVVPLQANPGTVGIYPHIHSQSLPDILSRGGIRSIVISSLIFLTVYAWIDVITQLYKNWVLGSSALIECFHIGPDMTHFAANSVSHYKFRKPKDPADNPNNTIVTELNVTQKTGYAILLTFIAYLVTYFLIYWA